MPWAGACGAVFGPRRGEQIGAGRERDEQIGAGQGTTFHFDPQNREYRRPGLAGRLLETFF